MEKFGEIALQLVKDQKRGILTPKQMVDALEKARKELGLGQGWA